MQHIKFPKSILQTLQLLVVIAYWWIFNFCLQIIIKLFFKKIRDPKKILIFRTGSLGDSLCAIPAIVNIRKNFPNAQIDILSNTGAQSLVSLKALLAENIYDNFIDYLGVRKEELIELLVANKYDAVIQLTQNQTKEMNLVRDIIFFRWFVGIKQGFGWQYATVRFFRKVQENHLRYSGEIERLLHILQINGLAVDPDYTFALKINDQDIEFIRKEAEAIQIERPKPLVGVVVGAKRPQNRWPLPFFRIIVEQLVKTYNVVVIGGPEDIPLAETLADLPGVFIRCGRYTPIQSGLMLRHCELCLSNDTGPMHLAYSFSTPVVALFSARDFPYKWFPPESDLNVVLRKYDIHCSLCLTETCTNNICMQAILPIEVTSAINQVLTIKKLPLIEAFNHVSGI